MTSSTFPKFLWSSSGDQDPREPALEQPDEVAHGTAFAGGLPAPHVRRDLERPDVDGRAT